MKKLTSEMLKGVGYDTTEFDKTFPNGMDINVFNVDRIKKSLEMDIDTVIDRLLPIDMSVEYNKRLDEVNIQFNKRFDECHERYNFERNNDFENEYARNIKESMRRERLLRRRYNALILPNREEFDREWDAIDNERMDREIDVALDILKKCDNIRCIGKTM